MLTVSARALEVPRPRSGFSLELHSAARRGPRETQWRQPVFATATLCVTASTGKRKWLCETGKLITLGCSPVRHTSSKKPHSSDQRIDSNLDRLLSSVQHFP